MNADALQLYEGLPIVKNTIRSDDMKGIPHHLLGCIGIEESSWTVGKFTTEARKVIQDVLSRGKLPVVVGGTHYYVQSLILPGNCVDKDKRQPHFTTQEIDEKWPILRSSNETILTELRKVDPAMAARWHPKDTRKIRRSLEIWLQTGRRASDIYEEQKQSLTNQRGEPDSGANGVHAEPDAESAFQSLVIWLHCESPVLNDRLSRRVDRMLEEGLLEEISYMRRVHEDLLQEGKEIDTSKGAWVAIGYKEFEPYLQGITQNLQESQLMALMKACAERTVISTRQYAKRQVRWIRTKLLPAMQDAKLQSRLFMLDGSNIEAWTADVETKACTLVGDFLSGRPLPDPLTVCEAASILSTRRSREELLARTCETCHTTVTTNDAWEQHLKSKSHKFLSRRERNPEVRCMGKEENGCLEDSDAKDQLEVSVS